MKHFARKRFGQHFLTDRHIIGAIVDAIDPQTSDAMVEIGPGLGAMTNPLVERCGRLTVIELDRDLAEKLARRPELNVVQKDVLKVDFAELAATFNEGAGAKLRVVGNLPYNISTPILFHLLEFVDDIIDQHFMLQKEVVERMAASPGSKDYGRLSVMLQWRYHIESVLDVPPESFDPPPRVDSAIVRMLPLPHKAIGHIDARLLGETVSVAFSQRRKMLRNTLGHWLEQRQYGGSFDLQRRAEEVPVSEYLKLVEDVGLLATSTSPTSPASGRINEQDIEATP
ncbi:16S rRNA (adenine(1518)-N(6)/adenine(1519)-N(6))-dimethyltransferaseRsmA [soil metagenome]